LPVDRLEQAGLSRAWIEASAALPLEWHLEGLTCASTGLAPDQRSDRCGYGRLDRTARRSRARVTDRSRPSMPWPASCDRCEGRRVV